MALSYEEANAEAQGRSDAKMIDKSLIENQISTAVIDAAIEVHRVLGGPGLLESVYEDALAHELGLRKMKVQRQLAVPVVYKGCPIRDAMRLDLLVGDCVIVEVKATDNVLKIHSAQVLTYLRMTQHKLGLVLNFGQSLLKEGISRVVNNL